VLLKRSIKPINNESSNLESQNSLATAAGGHGSTSPKRQATVKLIVDSIFVNYLRREFLRMDTNLAGKVPAADF
jgi:hypothetical protein